MKNKVYFFNNNFRSINCLWKTDFFREQQLIENSFINLVVKKVSEQKLCFYEFSNESLEKRHMTPWFNHIALRQDYAVDIIADMYLIHELFHIASLPEPTTIITDFEEWKSTMWENELYASLATEVFIYAWMPEIRDMTFKFDIWFDSLRDQYGFTFTKENIKPEHLFDPSLNPEFKKVIDLRLEFRNGKEPTNESEQWFVRYNNYNKWFERWRDDFINVQQMRNWFINNLSKFEKESVKLTKNDILFNFYE